MAKKKKNYNLLLYELQQEAVRNAAITGSKVSNSALEKQAQDEYLAPIRNVNLGRKAAENTERKKKQEIITQAKANTKKSTSSNKTTTSKKSTKEEEKRTWFSKGAFSDGYDFGDITKTILGTAGDIGLGAAKGLYSMGEGVADLVNYGIAGVDDLLGNDYQAENRRKKAMRSSADEVFAPLEKSIDPISVIGEKGDSISQGLGYVGGIILTGGLGGAAGLGTLGTTALTTGITGLSSMGSGMGEAYQGGATNEEALKYGIIAGVAEAGSELIFGGLGKAVNAVGLSKGLSSLDDALAKKISSMISSTVGKNIAEYTVKSSAEGVEEIISGIAQGIGKKMTYMSDEDLVQILKDENLLEQFVVGTVTSSIAQAPGLVKTTSEGKPFISDYKQDNQTQVEGLQQEIAKKTEELNKSQDAREKQIIQETINGLNEELNELTNAQQITDESELRKQNFTYEAQENDSDIKKAVYESASKVMNNTTTTHKFVDVVAKIAEEKGTTYKFTNNEQLKQLGYTKDNATVNGLVNENGEVLINIDSAKMINTVVGHETTHLLEGTKEYDALKQMAIEYSKTKGDYDARIEKLTKLYEGTNADIEAELTSDIVGEYLFTDENFVRELSIKQPTVFEKIRNFISDLVVKFKGTAQEKQLRQLQRTFEKAYKAQGTQTSTDTKYSLNDNQGRTLTKEQQEYFKDSKVRDENGNLLTMYHGTMHGGFNTFNRPRRTNMQGFYFTNSKEYSNTFEGIDNKTGEYYESIQQGIDNGTYTPKTYEVYLDIKNPLVLTMDQQDVIEDIGYWENIYNSVKELGYDGVIMEDKSQAFVFNSNQIKNVDNTNPTTNPDIRYSLSKDTKGRKLSKEQIERYKYVSDKLKDENGNLKVYYHGTQRADRVGTLFDPNRATSGPMAFFTDSEEIATNYSTNKSDTSLSREYDTEYDLFKVDGQDLDSYWNSLSYAEKQKINKEGNNVGFDDDWESIVYGENASENSFSDMYKWYLKNETNGNGIKALYQVWIQDGNIMDDDLYKFQEVLEKAGIKNVEFLDPYKTESKVYETYLNIKNPFDTSNMSEDIINQFKEASKTATIGEQYSADAWDKSNIAPEDWISKLESDIKEGTTHAWTVIPDWVTDVLKANGYDGIVDTGGKNGGVGHQVVIPFYSEQVKDVNNQKPTDNPNIDMSLSAQNEEIAPTGQWNVRGEDVKLQVEEAIAPLQEKIESLTEQLETVVNSNKQPTIAEEITNLMNIKETQSGSDYARAFFDLRDKYGQPKLYKALNEYYKTGTVTEPNEFDNLAPTSQDIVEQQGQEAFNHITDEQVPSWEDAVFEAMDSGDFEYSSTEHIPSPLDSRDIDEVGNRKVKAYQYENPEVKPYFQTEAQNMLYDLDNTIKGEKGVARDELGNMEYYGITRQTTEAIAYLKDNYGYSYEQIRQGLNKIIEDDGKENNAVSKRIEFMLDERLREGYTTSDGYPIPPNEDYINFLNEKQVTEYNKEAFNALTDADVPLEQATMNVEPELKVSGRVIPQETKTAQNGNIEAAEGKQRKWIGTSTESEVVNREILPDDLDQSKIFYQPITNKATLGKANSRLDTMGYEKATKYFNNQFLSKKTTVEDIVLGERLIQEAIKKGDTKTAGDIIQDVAILGTELGQKVQALSIIQRMTPEGQLKMLEKTINRGKTKGDKAFTDVNLTQEMKDKILKTYNEDGSYDQNKLNEVMDEVKQEVADQMQVTVMDKINAWRYLSMLGNPKTHIRNLVSNVAMKGTVAVKNALARTIETVAPIENRTKTWKAASDDVINFAKQTTLEMKDVISGDSKYSETTDIKAKREIFKNKVLEKMANLNSDLLEKEDWWFSKGAFESSFREFLTANGIETQQDIENNPELIEKGKNYAVEQAQIATFRQYSWLANKIRDIENKNAATQIAVGAVLPFKKTPINIAKTGLSYSPLGFAKTLTYDIAQVKNGNMEASTLIDHLAQNTTGTALTLVGYMLAQAGFLNGAGDDDKEGKYDYQLGKQAYSINIDGSTYSLSWLSPVAMPLFVGANAFEQLVEGEEWNADVVLETLGQTLDPLSEMSFLSSLDSVLSSYDSGVQRFFGIGEAMAQNYVTQFAPTLMSQIAATKDDTKRSTKVSGDSTMKVLEETYNKLIYKIPGLRETLEPSTDIWGNEIKQNEDLFTRAFENFIAPYARKDSIATEIDEELKDLYGQTGDTGLLPSIPSNYVNYDGEKYNMSAEEYTDYKKMYGQTANDLLEDLFRTTTYQRATSEERTDMVNDVYDYARDEAKLDYLAKEGVNYTNAKGEREPYYGQGNIDLNNRPVVENEDGSISTVRSMSFNEDGQEVLIPTVVNGEIVSDEEAIQHYYDTGEYLGKFNTVEEADRYAEQLHEQQERLYQGNEEGKYYKENLIKGAIENDMTTKEYGLYLEDPEGYKFLMEKDYEYRQQYFNTYDGLKALDKSFDQQKEGISDDDELDTLYSEKKAGIIDKIINSGLDDTEKASLYKRYYNSDTVDTVMKSAISIDDYLVYETKEFKADKNAKGNSIPGSRKEKVIDYVNTLDMSIGQKAILIKSTNTFKFNDYNTQIVQYLDGLGLPYDEFVSILNDLDMTVKDGYVYWD